MTPEELAAETARLLEDSAALVKQATEAANLASLAFATGNFPDYWKQTGEEAKQRLDERYEEAKHSETDVQSGHDSG